MNWNDEICPVTQVPGGGPPRRHLGYTVSSGRIVCMRCRSTKPTTQPDLQVKVEVDDGSDENVVN